MGIWLNFQYKKDKQGRDEEGKYAKKTKDFAK